jgi:hypothetical protein
MSNSERDYANTIYESMAECGRRLAEEDKHRLKSEMVEKVAASICERVQTRAYGRVLTSWRAPEMSPTYIEGLCDTAIAAIKALRDPTRKMLSAGGYYHILGADAVSESDMAIALREWQAMIDEALR